MLGPGNTGLDEEGRLKGEELREGGFPPACPHLSWQALREAGGRGAGASLQVSQAPPFLAGHREGLMKEEHLKSTWSGLGSPAGVWDAEGGGLEDSGWVPRGRG